MTNRPAKAAEHCPVCGKPNQCAMELERISGQKQPPCWCTQATFSANLLAQIPADLKNSACVCAQCVQESQHN